MALSSLSCQLRVEDKDGAEEDVSKTFTFSLIFVVEEKVKLLQGKRYFRSKNSSVLR